MEKKINNGVSVEKAVATAKANASITLSSLFSKVKQDTNGLLKTSLGQKTEIYKKELFAGMTDSKIKAARKKIRNYTFSLLSTIAETKDKKLINAFVDFYRSAYVINDFSFSSIASENTKQEKKPILQKGLDIVKTEINK